MNLEINLAYKNGKFEVDQDDLKSKLGAIQKKYDSDMAGIAELIDSVIGVGEIKSVSSIQTEAVKKVEKESEKVRVHNNILKYIATSKNFVFADGKQGPKGKIESCIKRIK
jgi:hypothetical protein